MCAIFSFPHPHRQTFPGRFAVKRLTHTFLLISNTTHLATPQQGPRALLLAPTRELAAQIHREVERLAQGKKLRVGLLSKSLAAVGRASGAKNVLGHFDVMVATPMRLVAVLRQGAVDLSAVEVRAPAGGAED